MSFFSLLFFAVSGGEKLDFVEVPDNYTKSIKTFSSYIDQHCSDTRQKLWTLQAWLSENVVYDFSVSNIQTQYDAYDLSLWTLKNKKGVCANFANLFSSVSNEMGIPMFVVEGYVNVDETEKFKRLPSLSHAWCACVIDSVPYLFDPTWCSGAYVDSDHYEKNLNERFFMVSPDSLINSHVPYDPLFRFQTGDVNWLDSLSAYFRLDSISRMEAAYDRIVRYGDKNKYAVEYASKLKHNIDVVMLESLWSRCERLVYQISDLHNSLVDLTFVSPGVERSLQNKINMFRNELDDALEQLKGVDSADKDNSKIARETRSYILSLIKRTEKCDAMLKKKKR